MIAKPENQKSKPGVFVFVPSYNHAAFVERCLKSIIKQTFQPAKLLVIDDGSRDDSQQIIERVLQNCPFPAEFIARPNRGLSATLNEGFAKSFGKYFAYLGSDDVWLPEFLMNRVEMLEKRLNAVLAYGHAFSIDAENRVIDCTTDWAQFQDGDVREWILRGGSPLSPTVVYRRAAIADLRWNEQARLEDYEFYLRLSERGEFAFDAEILAGWRQHGENASDDLKMMLDEILAAQSRVAAEKNLNPRQLEKSQTEIKLLYAENFARRGFRAESFRLWRENSSKTSFARPLLRNFIRLLTPHFLVNWRQNKRKQKFIRKYGRLEV